MQSGAHIHIERTVICSFAAHFCLSERDSSRAQALTPAPAMAPPSYGDLGKQARDLFSKNYRKKAFTLRVNLCQLKQVKHAKHASKTSRPNKTDQSTQTNDSHEADQADLPSSRTSTNVSLTFIDFGLIKLDVKTRTPAGVEFTVNGASNNDTGRVNASLETKYFFRDWGFTLKEKWNTDNTLATEVSLEDQLIKGSKLAFAANFAPQSGKKAGSIKSSLKADHFNASADVDLDYGGALFHGSAVLGYSLVLQHLSSIRLSLRPKLSLFMVLLLNLK